MPEEPLPALITTVAATDANSYVTLAFADQLFGSRLEWEDWSAFSEAKRSRALVSATANIDNELRGFGAWYDKYDTVDAEQALMFPRTIDRNDSGSLEIPDAVEEATCLLALHLMLERAGATGPVNVATMHDQGVTSVATGGISIQTFLGKPWSQWPRQVRRLVIGYFERGARAVAGHATSYRLRRKWWMDGSVAP